MSILIPGMELPKECIVIYLWPDGTFNAGLHPNEMPFCRGKAIELPPHGRLGDLDAIPTREQFEPTSALEASYCDGLEFCREFMPTIIPADPDGGDAT